MEWLKTHLCVNYQLCSQEEITDLTTRRPTPQQDEWGNLFLKGRQKKTPPIQGAAYYAVWLPEKSNYYANLIHKRRKSIDGECNTGL